MTYLSLGMSWMREVKGAEEQAHRMMEVLGEPLPLWGERRDEKWIEAFGDTETELKEHEDALARRVKSIPFWRRRERRAAIRAYISVHAMLTVAYGCETVWR